MKLYWDKLLSKQTKRVREKENEDTKNKNDNIDHRNKFDQDYDRIIFNPAFRIVTYLESIKDLFGLNLTYATLASSIKYPVDSTKGNNGEFKKFGYFQSEKDFAEDVLEATSLLNSKTGEVCRHPLVLLLEAADDIAYSVGDIEDGFKKGIFALDYLLKLDFMKDLDIAKKIKIPEYKNKYYTDDKIIMDIRIYIQGKMIRDVLNVFINKYNSIMGGQYSGELLNDSESGEIREKLYEISKDKIFSNPKIYEIEFSGVKALEFLTNMFLEEFSKKNLYTIYIIK